MTDDYLIDMYGSMLADPVRMNAYLAAMARAIEPGDTVLDIGTGPGVTAILACKMGASHVYAVDPNPVIRLGERLAHANNVADRITFVEGLSTELALDRPVDVMISDLRGCLPLHGDHIPAVIDARKRLLRSGGVQIPTRDRLFVGLARDTYQLNRLRHPWLENEFNLDLSSAYIHVINLSLRSIPGRTLPVGKGVCWAELDYKTDISPNATGSVTIPEPGGSTFNGLELWFEAELLPGIRYSTSPQDPAQVYGRTFLPLRDEVTLGDDEVVNVQIDMRRTDSGYLTTWRVWIRDSSNGQTRVNMEHSTFFSTMLNSRSLRKESTTAKHRAVDIALKGFRNGSTLAELVTLMMNLRPCAFNSTEEASAFVTELDRLLR